MQPGEANLRRAITTLSWSGAFCRPAQNAPHLPGRHGQTQTGH